VYTAYIASVENVENGEASGGNGTVTAENGTVTAESGAANAAVAVKDEEGRHYRKQ